MAHYAFLNENNIVTEVITGKNENEDNTNWETHYGNFRNQTCKRTSYNTKGGVYYTPDNTVAEDQSKAFRKNYASIGYSYDADKDAFIPNKPYNSWTLNNTSCLWEAPVAYPNDGQRYVWNETDTAWDQV
tara:strand:- start:164 stop:553 length:390 start_codon:yes stop_codon:yes gene_type:complete